MSSFFCFFLNSQMQFRPMNCKKTTASKFLVFLKFVSVNTVYTGWCSGGWFVYHANYL